METEYGDSHHQQKPLKTHKELVKEFYSGITLHGFHFLFEGGNFRRLIWFLICSAVFTFSVFLFQDLLSDYLEHKTHTSISSTPVTKDIDFPTIVICPFDKSVSSGKLKDYPVNISITDFVALKNHLLNGDGDINQTRSFVEELVKHGIDTKEKFINSYDLPFQDVSDTEVLKYLMPDGSCSFYGQPCNETWFATRIMLEGNFFWFLKYFWSLND